MDATMTKRPKRILATIIIFLSLLFTIIYIDDIQKWFNQYTDKLTQNHKGQGDHPIAQEAQ